MKMFKIKHILRILMQCLILKYTINKVQNTVFVGWEKLKVCNFQKNYEN
jgi:hypothetical protein